MKRFPILSRTIKGKRLVYLDNAATTQKPWEVIDTISRFYQERNANIHRGVHTLSVEATVAYEQARAEVAQLINCMPEQLVFTSGTTDALNRIADWARSWLRPGDEIIVTIMEHHANLVPWQQAAKQTGATLVPIGMTGRSELDMESFKQKLNARTKLVCVTHASNLLGTILPIAELAKLAHTHGAKIVVDGAQAVGHLPVDVTSLDADFYAFGAHKMYGPTGIGAFFIREPEAMEPVRFGGEMIDRVTIADAVWADPPQRFEAGTPNIAGAIGMAAAAAFVREQEVASLHAHEQRLARLAWERLSGIPEVQLFGVGPNQERTGVVSFTVAGIHPHDVAQVLDDRGVAIRTGNHCAEPLVESLGQGALCRASFAIYNTEEDIAALVQGVRDAIALFTGEKR